jgi:cytoskeletal protein CcmA (bactofilin family)
MFRKKDNDPVRPGGVAEKLVETSPTRSPLELRPAAQPELPPRRVDLPTAPFTGPGADRSTEAPKGAVMIKDEAGKRLIVGQGISLSGEITACDRLVVEGSVQVTLNQTRAIEITESGRFTNGKAEVEEAEISGTYEGELTVRNLLLIRSTGQVKGTVRYGELEIERGGKLSGSVSMLDASGKPSGSVSVLEASGS